MLRTRPIRVVIRTDAAVHIGSGHVMRCLTLANELRRCGAQVTFVTRNWEGNLQAYIVSQGYQCLVLPRPNAHAHKEEEHNNSYASWLGVPCEYDAEETLAILAQHGIDAVDWCITDHYAIDARWHRIMRGCAAHIMVIDDIANREHDCDVLLDQNLYDSPEARYEGRVPKDCLVLLGPTYALLRPEFREVRRRLGKRIVRSGTVQRIVIFFGGSDPSNETSKAVRALHMLGHREIQVDVIVGVANPHRCEVEELCMHMPNMHFHCQVPNMADVMAQADLALGAGGSTTWERCCMGLPTIAMVIAENQAEMTETAARYGVQWNLGWSRNCGSEDIAVALQNIMHDNALLHHMSFRAQQLVDGYGVQRVLKCSSFRNMLIG
ncbi:MAG: UDP-2,4-diacetamido-2,4,6-trideoxy-beta-L-altropyranose hydrolase [Bacteroidota bacterium]|nr:UDP-2,4-diacetamido-2,4,6-trideoxy-beta-L-altropyranose hydrolase [Candidatus Kapabacteria bacterium]MDW8221175.1 UDP-2,4-diacetamido-2,4,6-trideoxy-beta-L-altropyranose hydrolase [Bacteroidota bacterium]